jgi:hypothetical protein
MSSSTDWKLHVNNLKYKRLRNIWKGSSGGKRRPSAYGGIVGEGVPRTWKANTGGSIRGSVRGRGSKRVQKGARALNEHAD